MNGLFPPQDHGITLIFDRSAGRQHVNEEQALKKFPACSKGSHSNGGP
ncbi:hypothetical protein ACVIGB_009934 [Bradyrhizobium sp. USDA 4341]